MKNKAIGSSFDDFLTEEGLTDEVESGAIKKIIVYQLQEAIKKERLSPPYSQTYEIYSSSN